MNFLQESQLAIEESRDLGVSSGTRDFHTMLTNPDRRWERLIKEKRRSLANIVPRDSFHTKNYEGFRAYFGSVVANSSLSNESGNVRRFITSLERLRSFTTAASIASQDEEGVDVIWTLLCAIIEVAYKPLCIIGSRDLQPSQLTSLRRMLPGASRHYKLSWSR